MSPFARLDVHVTPRASHEGVSGMRQDRLAVRVTVPPDGGRANAAVCRVVAEALAVPRSTVSVARGHTGRMKTLEIDGIEQGRADALVDSVRVREAQGGGP